MFVVTIFVFAVYSICRNEIQCSVIWRQVINEDVQNLTEPRINIAFLKKNQSTIELFEKNQSRNYLDGAYIATLAELKNSDQFLISNRKKSQSKKIMQRQPKFVGPLAFLTGGLNNANLATVESTNTNVFRKLLNGAVPLQFGPSGYFTSFYNPQHYFPYSYPIFYSLPSVANNYQNLINEIPIIHAFPATLQLPEKKFNVATEKAPPQINSNANNKTKKQSSNDEDQENTESTSTQVNLKKVTTSNINNDEIQKIDLPATGEETKLRQSIAADKDFNTTTMTRIEPTMATTMTTASTMTINTTIATNVTTSSGLPENTTFYSYYGGMPQDVENVILTTEDPQQRYLKDYTQETGFTLPFERPAIFNPYQNVESYSNPFVHSFSSSEQFPEFLNTIESDRYSYDSENQQNFNGFRPMLK